MTEREPTTDPPRGPRGPELGIEALFAARAARAQSRTLAERVREVASATPTPEEQSARIVESALRAFGATAAVAARLVGDEQAGHLELEAAVHVPAELLAVHRRTPMATANPLVEAVRTGTEVTCTGAQSIRDRYPALGDLVAALGAESLVAVPVRYFGSVHGALGLVFTRPHVMSAAERAQLRALGGRYARALVEARLYFAEREARAQAEAARTEAETARREAEVARAALQVAHARLESRIAERTTALARANAELTTMMAQRAQADLERDALRRELASAEEQERSRLARELHDQLGQYLTAFQLGLADARQQLAEDAPVHGRLARLQVLAERMTRDTRYLALELRPPELDDVGLESALATYVDGWAARYGIGAEVAITGLAERRLPGTVGTALYRIVQEALTNVARHAQATEVSVIVDKPDGEVQLIVEDDGRGFDVEATAVRARADRRLGLAGMRERVALAGGTLTIESSPGHGTTIYVRLPIAAGSAAESRPDAGAATP